MHILTVPNEVLHQKSTPVKFPLSREDKDFLKNLLKQVMDDEGAAGLAAVQVGKLIRAAIVTDMKRNPTILINPQITFSSSEQVSGDEGCLSIPGKEYEIKRAKVVKVKYQDQKGKWVEITARDWYARVIQHEIDHMNGTLVSDIGKLVEKQPEDKDI